MTLILRALLPSLRTMLPPLSINSPGKISSSTLENLSNEGTAKLRVTKMSTGDIILKNIGLAKETERNK